MCLKHLSIPKKLLIQPPEYFMRICLDFIAWPRADSAKALSLTLLCYFLKNNQFRPFFYRSQVQCWKLKQRERFKQMWMGDSPMHSILKLLKNFNHPVAIGLPSFNFNSKHDKVFEDFYWLEKLYNNTTCFVALCQEDSGYWSVTQ